MICKHLSISILALFAALLAAPSASASTEVGWDCTANDTEPGWTVLAASSANLPMADSVPPEGPKVITGWRVKVGPGIGPLPQRLEVFEIKNEEHEFEKIGESATETLVEGVNSFATRIAADEGDSVGLYGPAGTLVCQETGSISRLFEGVVAVGEIKPFTTIKDGMPLEVGTPVIVTVEDDRDGDGYGDETQDRCPASALFQTDCPQVALSIGKVEVKRRAILIEVGINSTASVEALGEVCWTARPKADNYSRAKHSTVRRPCQEARVGLRTLGAQTIEPGVPVTLRVPLPKAVRKRLEQLSPRRSLRARIDVKATNLVPYTGTHELKVKLPGRAKPQRPR